MALRLPIKTLTDRTLIYLINLFLSEHLCLTFFYKQTHVNTQIRSSHSAVNEDSEQFASHGFQRLSIVELAQSNFHLQDVVLQKEFQHVFICHFI